MPKSPCSFVTQNRDPFPQHTWLLYNLHANAKHSFHSPGRDLRPGHHICKLRIAAVESLAISCDTLWASTRNELQRWALIAACICKNCSWFQLAIFFICQVNWPAAWKQKEFINRAYNESNEKSRDVISSNYNKVPSASIIQVQNQRALPGNCPWKNEFNK